MTPVKNKPEQYLTRAKIGRKVEPGQDTTQKSLDTPRRGYIDSAGYVHWNKPPKAPTR